MKICIFADARSAHIRGLVPGLVKHGLEVHVVSHTPAEINGATVERFRVPSAGVMNPRRWQERKARYLREFLRRFDLVNIHFLDDWGFASGDDGDSDPLVAERGCLVASPWGSDIVDPPGETPASPDLIRSRVSLLRRAAAVTTCGPTFARTVAEFAGLEADRVDVVPFGVDLDLFRPLRLARAEGDERRLVGFFKGFRPVYGPIHLIQAMPLILAELPGTRFELVGDGAQLGECRNLAVELGVDGLIEWIPRVAHSELPRILARWDLSLIPSIHEAFGVAVLESAAMGLPVVASDVCGLRDTVRHGLTGLLIAPQSPPAIAEAVVTLLADDGLRSRMGRDGREMVEHEYDWRAIHPRWVRLYAEAREICTAMVS